MDTLTTEELAAMIKQADESTTQELKQLIQSYKDRTDPLIRRLNELKDYLATIERHGHVRGCLAYRGRPCSCSTVIFG